MARGSIARDAGKRRNHARIHLVAQFSFAMTTMSSTRLLVVVLCGSVAAHGRGAAKTSVAALSPSAVRPDDKFNFASTVLSTDPTIGNSYGPRDWNLVHCNDVKTCPGYPTNWNELNPFIPYNSSINMCLDCSRGSTAGNCATNNQSPIALYKNVTRERICYDRHRMNYVMGNGLLENVDFQILPHVLRAYQPNCTVWPTVDFSWGFPYPWRIRYTDVTVPSQHTIDGKRYSAEIILSHTYSANVASTLIGNIAVMVEVGSEADFYPFFELYLQGWEDEAARVAAACNRRRSLHGLETSDIGSAPDMTKSGPGANAAHESRSLGEGTQIVNRSYYKGQYHPYMFYKDTGTEYYFRYQGSVIEPPCLEYVHWRVLRLPIKISASQFKRVNALFNDRLNPVTCVNESAGRTRSGSIKKDVHRSLQTTTSDHRLVYCECIDWRSWKPNDVAYCNQTMDSRGVYPYVRSTA